MKGGRLAAAWKPKYRSRLDLTQYECDILTKIAKNMGIEMSPNGTPQYGAALLGVFRVLMEYAETHPTSDFSVAIRALALDMGKHVQRRKRGPLTVLAELREAIDAKLHHKGREDYTVEEAHDVALQIEGSRLIKEAKRAKRRKRLSSTR